MSRALAIALVATAACAGNLDPPWQLDHDRIIAVRATPPSIAAGQTATIDALLAQKGRMTSVATPELATVVSPASLSDVLSVQAGSWVVTAPSEDRLAAARGELALAAGAPVPLEIGVSYANRTLVATKTIDLGQPADNPTLQGVTVDGKDPGDAEIVVAKLVKVPLSIAADDAIYDVAWLTSCGTMHDFDLPQAYLKVEADDPDAGELAVILRDAHGGVSWQMWPISAP
jgi:hypothetical protein